MLEEIRSLGLMVILALAAWTDHRRFEIPDRLPVAGIVWWFLFLVVEPEERWERFIGGILGGLLIAGGLLALSLVMDRILDKESLGGGDIKLIFVTGLFLGVEGNLLNLMLTSILGILLGVLRRCRTSEEIIPLAPAIALSTGICMIWGQNMIEWYLSLF